MLSNSGETSSVASCTGIHKDGSYGQMVRPVHIKWFVWSHGQQHQRQDAASHCNNNDNNDGDGQRERPTPTATRPPQTIKKQRLI
ncbi:unnamed protein product [Nippostrongylus brasiliensis]|uniref:Uncharacterized protein n=1 Tax=Nippostrongylus brasiliensis TaxID=27835 RepID=A0A0N4Y6F3_NIPBR|nr:unnamed protein product [Nippostrongylus brasiliensis]